MEFLCFIQRTGPLLAQGALMTVVLTFISTAIGFIVGSLMGIALCARFRPPFIVGFLEGYVLIVRGTPFFVQLLIVYYLLPFALGINLSPFVAGGISLGICSTGYIAEIVRSGINALPQGQWHACHVLGYTTTAALWHVILPQVFTHVLPALANEIIQNMHSTAMLSAIGAMELTKIGSNIIAREMNPIAIYLTIALMYLGMTCGISLITSFLERRNYYGNR